MEPNSLSEKTHFSEEGLENVVGFYEVLLRVHNRLMTEGYTVKDGKITPPEGKDIVKGKKAKSD